jgi:hypothetical protein
MAADIEAVIAALRVALDEAQKSDENFWQVSAVNRWIDQLPGSWRGSWRDLKLAGDTAGEVDRERFIGHARAVVAFLEASRTPTPQVRKWWSLRRRNYTPLPATQPAATPARAPAKPINLLRIRKPMPGLH